MRFTFPKPEAEESTFPEEAVVSEASNDSPFDADGVLVRYLECRAAAGRVLLLPEGLVGKGGTLTFRKLQAGYGRIFTDDSVITRGRHGAAWEEKSYFYLKTCFRF